MLMQKKLKILLLVYVALAAALTVRLPVVQRDIFDQSIDLGLIERSADHTGTYNATDEWNWAWVSELGHQADGSEVTIRWYKYAGEEIGLLVLVCLVYANHDKIGRALQPVLPYSWLVPLAVYVGVAVWRVLWVPCIWTNRYGFHPNQTNTYAYILPLWQIGPQDIRYGLIFFEELVLLALVAGCYALMFAASPGLRNRIKSSGAKIR